MVVLQEKALRPGFCLTAARWGTTVGAHGRWIGVGLEAQVALALCRWLLALAGIIIGLVAYYRASLRIDIPNTLMQENAKLKAEMKTLTGSVEQMLGAFEDRMMQAQKRAAAYASHESRRANTAAPAEGADPAVDVEAEPVGGAAFAGVDAGTTGQLAALAASSPYAARRMVRNARVTANNNGG